MDSDPHALGLRIRRARERKLMSQDDLAAAIGKSRSAVNAWENGRAYPCNSIGALEAVLDLDLTGDGDQPPAITRSLTERLARLDAALSNLERDKQNAPPG